MDDERLAELSVIAALENMVAKGWLDICTIDKCAKLLNRIPDAAAYKILSPIHCVSYKDMPADLRDAVPGLIARCLAVEWPPRDRVPPPSGEPSQGQRRGFLRLLPGRER